MDGMIVIIIGLTLFCLLLFFFVLKFRSEIKKLVSLLGMFGNHMVLVYQLKPFRKMIAIKGDCLGNLGFNSKEINSEVISIEQLIYKEDWPIFEFMFKYPELCSKKLIMRMITKSGKIIWTEHIYRGIKFSQGKITCVEGLIKDVTEEKLNEISLRESEEKFRELFDNATDMMFLLQLDSSKSKYRIIELNSAAFKKISYSKSEVVNIYFETLIKQESIQVFTESMKATLNKGHSAFEMLMTLNDGSIVLLDTNTSFFRLNNEKTILFVGRDITAKRKMENEVEKTQKLESLGLLSGGIAHDFNNLLTAVLGNISLIRLYQPQLCGQASETLIETENVLYRARDLTKQLLSFSKGFTLNKVKGDVSKVIQDNAFFIARGTVVKCEIELNNMIFIAEYDEGQVVQVVNNLVINAAQAMKNGGILKITGEVIEVEDDNYLKLNKGTFGVFHFQDNGHGIFPEDIKLIFDPFYTTKSTGTGLGLSSVYSIMKKHNGKITVESEVGQGACFNLYFPLLSEEEKNIYLCCDKDDTHEKIYKGNGKILIMDDNPDILIMAKKMMTFLGYEVYVVSDGNNAVRLYHDGIIKNSPFNAVILDMTIQGGIGGVETLKKLKAVDENVKAIVSSGYTESAVMNDCIKIGFRGSIAKPYTVELLSSVLKEIIG